MFERACTHRWCEWGRLNWFKPVRYSYRSDEHYSSSSSRFRIRFEPVSNPNCSHEIWGFFEIIVTGFLVGSREGTCRNKIKQKQWLNIIIYTLKSNNPFTVFFGFFTKWTIIERFKLQIFHFLLIKINFSFSNKLLMIYAIKTKEKYSKIIKSDFLIIFKSSKYPNFRWLISPS